MCYLTMDIHITNKALNQSQTLIFRLLPLQGGRIKEGVALTPTLPRFK